MRIKKVVAALAVVVLALASGACLDWPSKPDVSQDVNVNVNVNSPAPAASPSPSPSPSASPTAVHGTKVTQFGETCPAATQPGPADRDVRVGCTISLTCTPTDAAGRDVGAFYVPTFAEVGSSGYVSVQTGSDAAGHPNPYNLSVKGVAPGTARFACTVGGVPNEVPFDLVVVP